MRGSRLRAFLRAHPSFVSPDAVPEDFLACPPGVFGLDPPDDEHLAEIIPIRDDQAGGGAAGGNAEEPWRSSL